VSALQCNGCRFWKLQEDTADELNADWGFGYCRRKPPTLVDSLVAADIQPPRYGQQSDLERPTPLDAFSASIWPSTFATEWCGEHSRAPHGGGK
jgi:hypothetical protein